MNFQHRSMEQNNYNNNTNNNTNNSNKSVLTLAEIMARKMSINNNNSSVDRLGDQPLPFGGGGPDRPSLKVSSINSNSIESTTQSIRNSSTSSHINSLRRSSIQQMTANQSQIQSQSYNNYPIPPETTFEEVEIPKQQSQQQTQQLPPSPFMNTSTNPMDSLSVIDYKTSNAMTVLKDRHEKHIIETVFRDVIQRDLGVTFDDIAALDTAKRLLNEAIILPLMIPEFFIGIREPWKGVLLFGPPG